MTDLRYPASVSENIVRASAEAHIGEKLTFGPNDIGSVWTEGRCYLLAEKWSAGYSAARISEMLGVSRNAVIGKVHRLRTKPSSARPKVLKVADLVRVLNAESSRQMTEAASCDDTVATIRYCFVGLLNRLADELEAGKESNDDA